MPPVIRMRLPYWDKISTSSLEPPIYSEYFTLPRLRKLGVFLLPSFLTQNNGTSVDGEKAQITKKRDTDYLDGLRGVAAFIVVVQHLIQRPYPAYQYGFASADENWHIFQLPFLRLVYSGGSMVAVFFVISGFALSSKGIQLIRSQSPSLYRTLASTTFRRSVRLWLPSVAVSFVAFLLQRMGLLTDHPLHHADTTWSTEIQSYIGYVKDLVDVYTWKQFKGFYNPHLWTIPVEFRCSMVIFLCLLGLSRTKTMVRISVEVLIIAHASWNDRWDVISFIGGLIIAEQYYHRKAHTASTPISLVDTDSTSRSEDPNKSRSMRMFYFATLALGLFMCSFPYHTGCVTPGFQWLCKIDRHQPLKDKWRYTSSYGAFLTVISISNLPSAQTIFTTPIASYLGKISYAFYLTHGLVLRVLVTPLQIRMLAATVKGPEIWYHGAVLMSGALLLGVAIPVADVVWRAVDVPSVELARWLEGKCAYEEKPVLDKGID
ncbi:acyltransferase family-domain-containing protein [Rhexocercosporidium sp. MPI-PUGE-AT-0058]|nr:acyltransferase family-domain-containing protein [Rhexocercosporidium sp. MPI-PUGE-AT-0058]